MEQYFSEVLLALIIGAGFPIVWKTNSLLTNLNHSIKEVVKLQAETVKSLRDGTTDHLKIEAKIDNLKTEILHAVNGKS